MTSGDPQAGMEEVQPGALAQMIWRAAAGPEPGAARAGLAIASVGVAVTALTALVVGGCIGVLLLLGSLGGRLLVGVPPFEGRPRLAVAALWALVLACAGVPATLRAAVRRRRSRGPGGAG